jgi:uncharacterized protein (TIGR02996 family)
MTTSTDEAALLAACAANPNDDHGWLVLADLLDYSGYNARAELIRVQVELARLPKGNPGTRSRLASRESAIIAANPTWTPECAVCFGTGRRNRYGHESDYHRTDCEACSSTGKAPCTWRAGYVSCVSVPTIGSVLQRKIVEVPDMNQVYTGEPTFYTTPDPSLNPEYEPTDYARYLHDHFSPTLTGVMPADRVPSEMTHSDRKNYCYWVHNPFATIELANNLPREVFDKLKTEPKIYISGTDWDTKLFPTAELARVALSRALRAMIWERIGRGS